MRLHDALRYSLTDSTVKGVARQKWIDAGEVEAHVLATHPDRHGNRYIWYKRYFSSYGYRWMPFVDDALGIDWVAIR